MNFAHPAILWGLLVLPVLLAVSLLKKRTPVGGSISAPSSWQRRGSIFCRLLGVAALILALAGPVLMRPVVPETVVAMIDVSQATSAADLDAIDRQIQAALQSSNPLVVIPYAQQAQVIWPGKSWGSGRLQ